MWDSNLKDARRFPSAYGGKYSRKGIVSEPSPKVGAWLLIAILKASSNSPRVSILNYLRRLQLMYYSRLLYR